MPVEFLSDEQERRYGRFTRSLSRAELDRFRFLDDSDLQLIRRRRSEYSMLGFGLQLVTVRCLDTFLPDPLEVPLTVLDYVAGQLGVADPSCVKRYTRAAIHAFEHRPRLPLLYACGCFFLKRAFEHPLDPAHSPHLQWNIS